MYLNFIAINGQVLNLNTIALIEDVSENESEPIAEVNTLQGDVYTFKGDDATALFKRMDLIVQVNDAALAQAIAATTGARS